MSIYVFCFSDDCCPITSRQ